MFNKKSVIAASSIVAMSILLTACGTQDIETPTPIIEQPIASKPLVNLVESGSKDQGDSLGNLWQGVKVTEPYMESLVKQCAERISSVDSESQKVICGEPLKAAVDRLTDLYFDSPLLLSSKPTDIDATAKRIVESQGDSPRSPWLKVADIQNSPSKLSRAVVSLTGTEVVSTKFKNRLQSIEMEIGNPVAGSESDYRYYGVSSSSFDELNHYSGSIGRQVAQDAKRVVFTIKYSVTYADPISETVEGMVDVMSNWSSGEMTSYVVESLMSGEFTAITS